MAKAKEQKAPSKARAYGMKSDSGGGGMVYVLGFIGAFVYYIQTSDTFWEIVLGLLKAIVWPAYVVFKLLESFYG